MTPLISDYNCRIFLVDSPQKTYAWLEEFIKEITKHCYTQNIKALGLMVSEKIFLCFPIVSQRELSVAMETRVLIRSGPKSIATFPPLQ